ncbi:MAG: chorismate mutase [bacterium]
MDIEDWRTKIDEIDLKLLKLLNERALYSIEIGKIKKQKDLPIYSPEREVAIIARMVRENKGPLGNDGVRRLFERIIDESRKLEKDFFLKNKNNTKKEK